jgi:hypothetical protein
MRIHPLSVDTVCFIFDNLSRSGKTEAEAFGVSVEQMKEKFLGMIKEPFGVVFCDNEDIPCAVAVLTSIGAGKWRTNLQATEYGLDRIGFAITRFLKNLTDDMIQRKHSLEILSASSNGTTGKWFKTMGFNYIGAEGKAHRFIKKGN